MFRTIACVTFLRQWLLHSLLFAPVVDDDESDSGDDDGHGVHGIMMVTTMGTDRILMTMVMLMLPLLLLTTMTGIFQGP